jgi:hypothetical protein
MPARFCRATRRNLVLAFLLAAIYALCADHAAGQTDTQLVADSTPAWRFAVEIKPIPTLLALAHDGAGVGLGAELQTAPRWSLFADATYMDLFVKGGEPEGDDRVARSRDEQNAAVGVRYYGLGVGNSWYLGAKLGGGKTHVVWSARNALMTDEHLTTLTEELQAGYRWSLVSGLLVRLGFGIGWTQADGATTPGAAVDLGVGYGF